MSGASVYSDFLSERDFTPPRTGRGPLCCSLGDRFREVAVPSAKHTVLTIYFTDLVPAEETLV